MEYVQIKELKQGMKNINAIFIVLEVGPMTLTKDSREVRTLRVADASACVNLSVWDQAGALLQPGDIVRLSRGYAALWRNVLTLYSGKAGDLQKVGEFCMLFNETVNMSEPQPVPATTSVPRAATPATTTVTPTTTTHHNTYSRPRGSQRGGARSGKVRGKINHAVTAVGWGSQKGEPHFIVKNSWSAGWGEGGFARLQAPDNTCGVLTLQSYPRLEVKDVVTKLPKAVPVDL